MDVRFRDVDPFNCWIWLNFYEVPTDAEKNYIDGVFDSWYVLGRLGGFNAENLQVHEEGSDLSWMSYDNSEDSRVMPALMHNLGHMEYQAEWARCWVDLGTSDSLAFDVLINSLIQIQGDIVKIRSLIIGGVNDDWAVESHPDSIFSPDRY